MKQAAVRVGGLRVLPIESSAAALERLQAVLPGSYMIQVQPSSQLGGIAALTSVADFDMVFFTLPTMAEASVYEVTMTLHQSKEALVATCPAFDLLSPAVMAKPVEHAEFLPGAIRHYREAGLLK